MGATSVADWPRTGPLAAIGVSMISVQAGASFAKKLFPVVGPTGAAALRVTLAALILGLAMRPWRRGLPKHDRRVILLYGVSLGAMNLLFYSSLQTVPLGLAVAVEFIGPLGVAVAASRRATDFLWVALAAAGLLALLPVWSQPHPLDPVGVSLALGAGGCWALYIVFGQKAGAAHGAGATAWGMMIATLVALPVGFAHAGLALFSPDILVATVGVALLSSVVPYTLEMFVLAKLSSRVFGTLMSVEPAVAALFGLLLLHETLTPLQCGATGVIMGASLGTVLTARGDQPDLAGPPADGEAAEGHQAWEAEGALGALGAPLHAPPGGPRADARSFHGVCDTAGRTLRLQSTPRISSNLPTFPAPSLTSASGRSEGRTAVSGGPEGRVLRLVVDLQHGSGCDEGIKGQAEEGGGEGKCVAA